MPIVFSTGGVSITSGPGKYLFIHSCDTVMVDLVHWQIGYVEKRKDIQEYESLFKPLAINA